MTPCMSEPLLCVSSAKVAEPLSDLSDDFVDLERLQKGRFLFQLRTPFHQDLIRSLLLVIAFINNLLDGRLPFLKLHRLFLLDFGIVRYLLQCQHNFPVDLLEQSYFIRANLDEHPISLANNRLHFLSADFNSSLTSSASYEGKHKGCDTSGERPCSPPNCLTWFSY